MVRLSTVSWIKFATFSKNCGDNNARCVAAFMNDKCRPHSLFFVAEDGVWRFWDRKVCQQDSYNSESFILQSIVAKLEASLERVEERAWSTL